jgi:hypothetical protein
LETPDEHRVAKVFTTCGKGSALIRVGESDGSALRLGTDVGDAALD